MTLLELMTYCIEKHGVVKVIDAIQDSSLIIAEKLQEDNIDKCREATWWKLLSMHLDSVKDFAAKVSKE